LLVLGGNPVQTAHPAPRHQHAQKQRHGQHPPVLKRNLPPTLALCLGVRKRT
jgi:hypothetical protein